MGKPFTLDVKSDMFEGDNFDEMLTLRNAMVDGEDIYVFFYDHAL